MTRLLCSPNSTITAAPTFGNAAWPRRLRALRICFLTWGVLLIARQSDALSNLERKGYVLTTVGSYMVIEKLGQID